MRDLLWPGLSRKIKDRRLILFVFFLFTALGLFLRFQYRAGHPLWNDEMLQIDLMKGSFGDLLRALPQIDFCPYFAGDYYLTYPFYKMFGGHLWGLAIPHILATIFSFYLFYLICQPYLKTVLGYAVALSVFAFNATLIEKSFEIRPYPMLVLLSMASFSVLAFCDRKEFKLDRAKQWLVGLFFVLLIWFHVYGAVMMAVPLVFFLGQRLKNPTGGTVVRRAVKFFSIVLLITAPLWAINILGRHLGYEQIASHGMSVFTFIPSPLENWAGFLKGIFCNLLGCKKLYFLFAGILLSFLLPHGERAKQVWFFLSLIILPLVLLLGLDLITGYPLIQRQFIWVMPFFALLLGWCWDSILIACFQNFNVAEKR